MLIKPSRDFYLKHLWSNLTCEVIMFIACLHWVSMTEWSSLAISARRDRSSSNDSFSSKIVSSELFCCSLVSSFNLSSSDLCLKKMKQPISHHWYYNGNFRVFKQISDSYKSCQAYKGTKTTKMVWKIISTITICLLFFIRKFLQLIFWIKY